MQMCSWVGVRLIGLVPARGGSKGILRKNLRLVDGLPLFLHAARTLSEVCVKVIVSSDDPTILSMARLHGYETHKRPTVDDAQTIIDAARQHETPLLVLQPTSPQITANHLRTLCAASRPAQLATSERHIYWHHSVPLTPYVNRQATTDWPAKTLGAYWFPDKVKEPETVVTVKGPIVDIDEWADLAVARQHSAHIQIHYRGNERYGSGHARRMLTLADELQQHHVEFVPTDDTDQQWRRFVSDYPLASPGNCDLTITDRLDTEEPVSGRWISFEDRNARFADLVVNALYPQQHPNEVGGPDWFIPRPEFAAVPDYEIRDTGKILVLFGGTDPSGLRHKTLSVVPNATVIEPNDPVPVAELMWTHDLLITSAGRTVYEAAMVGIPTIVMAQNPREASHAHLGYEHGNVFLGMGRLVSDDVLAYHVEHVLTDHTLREDLSRMGRPDGLGLRRVVHRIDGILEGL